MPPEAAVDIGAPNLIQIRCPTCHKLLAELPPMTPYRLYCQRCKRPIEFAPNGLAKKNP